jgi:hypothetical protein
VEAYHNEFPYFYCCALGIYVGLNVFQLIQFILDLIQPSVKIFITDAVVYSDFYQLRPLFLIYKVLKKNGNYMTNCEKICFYDLFSQSHFI